MAKSRKRSKVSFRILLVVLPFLAIGISVFVVFKGVCNYTKTSSYFKIRSLKTQGINDTYYIQLLEQELLGKNLFCVDVKDLAQRIRTRFPNFYSVAVRRVLPCELLIDAKERLPVAAVKTDEYYLFDADGVVLVRFTSRKFLQYPLITGIENQLSKIKVGQEYRFLNLRRALQLARVLKGQMTSLKEALGERRDLFSEIAIDASDAGSLSFRFGFKGPQVKVGDGDFAGRIELLRVILKNIETNLEDVKYIDLRLEEPVVSYR